MTVKRLCACRYVIGRTQPCGGGHAIEVPEFSSTRRTESVWHRHEDERRPAVCHERHRMGQKAGRAVEREPDLAGEGGALLDRHPGVVLDLLARHRRTVVTARQVEARAVVDREQLARGSPVGKRPSRSERWHRANRGSATAGPDTYPANWVCVNCGTGNAATATLAATP